MLEVHGVGRTAILNRTFKTSRRIWLCYETAEQAIPCHEYQLLGRHGQTSHPCRALLALHNTSAGLKVAIILCSMFYCSKTNMTNMYSQSLAKPLHSHDQGANMATVQTNRPFSSVLSTVVDHFMIPPSPMEPNEFKEAQEEKSRPTLVPILRVFGPIIRGDAPSGKNPVQSACLYIHGAFPYLLARPVIAGPDGSLHHSSHLMGHLTSAGHVDWDSVKALELEGVASIVHKNLEYALQASVIGSKEESSKNGGALKPKAAKFIREVTIVVGRGFYTYCPGPPAPFLRVEYYDPKMRWKIKLMLERGLELSHKYHPDPQQYDAVAEAPAADSSQLGLDPLKFHCFEAHIPYTMQFFKDWNLAGMSYIHLSDGLFRLPLPTTVRPRWANQEPNKDVANEEDGLAFLRVNTPSEAVWETMSGGDDTDAEDLSKLQQSSTGSSQSQSQPSLAQNDSSDDKNCDSTAEYQRRSSTYVNSFWAKKETTCDVELDVDVTSIMNVEAIMTELPEDKEDGKNVHWRAVPSLREVWQEERRRMSKLLPPKDDFLSRQTSSTNDDKIEKSAEVASKHTPPFTLSVKKDAPTPGARLAVQGMRRLINGTEGLEESFMEAIKQIVERYSEAVSQVDRQLRSPSRIRSTLVEESAKKGYQLAPDDDEALEALIAIPDQFDDVHGAGGALDSDSSQDISREHADKSERLSQTYYSNARKNAVCHDATFELSQRVDRGDCIVDGPFEHVEDFINPETLTPFDRPEDCSDCDEGNMNDIDNEEGLGEAEMEKILTSLATQTDAASPMKLNRESESEYYDNDVSSSSEATSALDGHIPSAISGDSIDGLSEVMSDVRTSPACSEPASGPSKPPSRRALYASPEALLKIPTGAQQAGSVPTWLPHCSLYNEIRKERISEMEQTWLPIVPPEGLYIQPSHPPPRRDEVVYWCRQKTKREAPGVEAAENKRKKPIEGSVRELSVDSNSREVLPLISAVQSDGVEEIYWEASQSQGLSMSQGPPGTSVNAQVRESSQPFTAASLSGSQSRHAASSNKCYITSSQNFERAERQPTALRGIENQGDRLVVEGGGHLKATTRPSPATGVEVHHKRPPDGHQDRYLPTLFTMMSIEVHVQCRTGQAGVNNSKIIAMTPDPERDRISAVCYVFGKDPGGGGALEIMERGCLFVPTEGEKITPDRSYESHMDLSTSSVPRKILGVESHLSIQSVRNERQLLLRLASIVRWKDPDMLVSWDTQSTGLGYIIERGASLGQESNNDLNPAANEGGKAGWLDMVRHLSRPVTEKMVSAAIGNPVFSEKTVALAQDNSSKNAKAPTWEGSGLGGDWDARVGAGSAAASIVGRLVFAGWKLIAEEVKHPNNSYLPAMVAAVLGKRIPHHDGLVLNNWYAYKNGRERWRVLHHRLVQATSTLLLFDALDIVGRAGEAARLSGVEFAQSFPGIRGSQYKVEGVLLRALKSLNSEERGSKRGDMRKLRDETGSSDLSEESKSQSQSPWKKRRRSSCADPTNGGFACGYFFFSPSFEGANKQEALEVQAMTLEPQSGHFEDPVVVCDFTALYPSLVIAYNLCYSTCAGKLSYHTTRKEMCTEGRTTGRVGPFLYSESRTATVLKHQLKSIKSKSMNDKDRAYAAPTGAIYVSESVVRGVLPQVLDELLSTRAMLKKASKEYKRSVANLSPSILRQLEARQLALKYVANVTYGYTSATFSGRCAMPVLADTIVELGRRTLANAINLANSWGKQENGKWNSCEVLYGDTDSLFIRLPGRSVEEAFEFGKEFCQEVTSCNPPPVQLKLEKVYLGSILQTKKKYCGMKFDSKDTKRPEFEAKGIETVRRDQCALTQKVLKNSLVMLFRNGVGAVKNYLFRQWSLILSGRIPVSDFILTGRVRSKYRGGRIGPVQAALFRRLSEADPRLVMRNKERLAYVIVATPGVAFRLRDCVVTPMELLEQWDALSVHVSYYVVKHVNAALQRCFGLAPHNIDINRWYAECPKPRRRIHFWPISGTKMGNSSMISHFFGSDLCSLCGNKCKAQGRARAVVCLKCREDERNACLVASQKLMKAQHQAHSIAKRCSSCNLCFEDSSTFAAVIVEPSREERSSLPGSPSRQEVISTPIAACTCIDCPTTYDRHRSREESMEAEAICRALDILP